MQITEVNVNLLDSADGNPGEKLLAFASITLDDQFRVRDLRILNGAKGRFVAMPSRKLMDRCERCNTKNHLRARFCNQCGGPLKPDRAWVRDDGRLELHADLAHPLNAACREQINAAVLTAYDAVVRDRRLAVETG